MQRLVLRIPDDLARELEADAKNARLTKSEVAAPGLRLSPTALPLPQRPQSLNLRSLGDCYTP